MIKKINANGKSAIKEEEKVEGRKRKKIRWPTERLIKSKVVRFPTSKGN